MVLYTLGFQCFCKGSVLLWAAAGVRYPQLIWGRRLKALEQGANVLFHKTVFEQKLSTYFRTRQGKVVTRLAFYRRHCSSPAFSPVGDTGHC